MKKDIFVFENGKLCRKDNTLMLQTENKKTYIPVTDVASIHVFGEVEANKSLLEFATSNQILLHYYNYYGHYVGTYYPREHFNSGSVILQQCSFYLDSEKRLELATKFIQGATKNILQVLKYYKRKLKDVSKEINEITVLYESLSKQDSVERLMAIEGNIRQIYYKSFNKIIDKEAFVFEKRTKRPPEDKINALISYGNSIVYNTVLTQIYQTQLDPRIGYLHTTNDRDFSLNLDIAELFKPLLVDRTIFSLLNKKVITESDFKQENGGIYLKEKARKIFIGEITEKLNTTVSQLGIGHKVSYRNLIRMEAYKVQKHITENEEYNPFVMRW